MNQSVAEKGTSLLAFLKASTTLRRRRVNSYGDGDRVIWFANLPTDCSECRSPFLVEDAEDSQELWLEVHKKPMPTKSPAPETVADWILAEDLEQFDTEPDLQPEVRVPIKAEEDSLEFGNIPVIRRLADYPDVQDAWLEYLVNEWEPWANKMRMWAQIQGVYENLDFMRRRLEESEERYELLIAVGLLQWRDPIDMVVKRHILSAPAEISLDAAGGRLTVVPAATFEHFRIELDMLEFQHQPSLEGAAIEAKLDELDVRAWNTTLVAPVLHEIANRLDANAQVDVKRSTPFDRADVRPQVSFAPALVLRERRSRAYENLISKFLETANNGEMAATRPWSLLLAEGEPLANATSDPQVDSDADSPRRQALERYLFPLPANEEQREIVYQLYNKPCVLVKGPPGTGKSHTIANLICHLLAMGDRILVTSQAPKALAVLRKLLPHDVCDLSVTALGSSREDQRLMEESVQGILTRKTMWRGLAHDQDLIEQTEKHLLSLEGELARVERFLRESREAETHSHTLSGGYQGTAAQIARTLDEQREQFGWLPDGNGIYSPFPLSDTETAFLAEMHAQLDDSTRTELGLEVGDVQLPDPKGFKNLIEELAAAEESAARAICRAATDKVEELGQRSQASLHELLEALEALEQVAAKATRVLGDLTPKIVADLLVGHPEPWDRLVSEAEALLADATARKEELGTTVVEIPAEVARDRIREDVRRRLDHFEQGGRRGFWIFRPQVIRETAYIEESCRVNGRKLGASEVDQLASIAAYLDLDRSMRDISCRWPITLPELPDRRQDIARAQDLTNGLLNLLRFFKSKHASPILIWLPGKAPDISSLAKRKEWISAVSAALEQYSAKIARLALEEVVELIRNCQQATAHPCLEVLAQSVTSRDLDAYRVAWDTRERIRKQKDRFVRYKALGEKLDRECSGVADLLRTTAGDQEWASRLGSMERAWAWSSANSWLIRHSDEETYGEKVRECHRLQRRIEKTTEKLVSVQAWRAFFSRLDDQTVQGLNAWMKAVGRIGKGTGKHAYRHRRAARRYAMNCVQQIPAWVMPLHRLWEMVEAKSGLFDIVIIDEASQASVDALALLLLAKQIIVVGDDKQNSPEAVGVPEESIARLAREHLKQFTFRDEFRPDASLFDHAERSFQNPITLREHFRCVPEIIRFSNDLCYGTAPLIPLRQAPPNRLPAMESRFIADGTCEGKGARVINRAEAVAVVEEIENVIRDDAYQGKSIGVIALQGHAQTHLIEQELVKRLPPTVLEKRRLRCGEPAAFQGDERDIIFISLVVAPNIRYRALTRLSDQRRFNVAMSRARDQVRLLHSVRQDDLGPEDLRHRLIAYFENPPDPGFGPSREERDRLEREARRRRLRGNQPEPYESWFEFDVALELLRREFIVHPQVEVAGYRIDLVLEGSDARLAIECDGDAWHGADQYEHDMARQRQLERTGWTFVRIRESAWYSGRDAAIKTVVDAAGDLGIRRASQTEDLASTPPQVTVDLPVLEDAPIGQIGVDLGTGMRKAGDGVHAIKTRLRNKLGHPEPHPANESDAIRENSNNQLWIRDVVSEGMVGAIVDADDTTTPAPAPMRLRWNERYEAAKPRLVSRMQALMRISDEGELAQAERVTAAIKSLPDLAENRGSLRIVNRVAENTGDSDFVYWLSMDEDGFELSYYEEMMIGGGQRDFAYPNTLVQCRPIDSEEDDESSDEEALANMRDQIELMFGESMSDEEWQFQVEAASAQDDLVPNGILRWLEMLPMDDEEECPKTVSLEWRG